MEINNLSEAVEILNEVLHVCGLTIEDLSPRTRNELSSLTLVTPSMWDSMEAWYCQKALGFSDYPVSRYKFLHTIIYECEGHWEWKYSRLANLLNLNDLEVELPKINSLSELMERLCIPDMRLVDFIQDLPPNCLSRMASASFLNDDIDGKYLEGVEELFEQEGDFEWGDLLTHLSYILDPNDIIEIDLGGSSIDAVKFLRSIGQCEQGLPWLKITDLSKFQEPIRNEDVFQLMTRPVGGLDELFVRMCSPVIPLVDLIEIIPNHFITTLLNESFDLQGVLLSEYVYDCDLLFTDHPMTRVVDILRHLSRVYAEEPFTKMDLYLDETLTRGEFSQLGNLLIESDVSKWLNIQEPPFNVSILEACLQKPELFKVFDPTLYSIKDVLQFLDSLDVNISSEIFEDSVAGHGLQFFSLEKSSTEAILFDSKCEWCPSLEAFSQYLNQHTKLVCKYIEQGMNHALYRVYWGDSGWVTDFEVYGESSTGGMFDDGGISTSTYLVSNPLLTEVMNWQEQGNAFVSSLKQILAGEHSDLSFEDVSLHCVLERPSLQDLESNTHTYSILEEQSQYFLECQGLYFHLYKDSRYRVNITEDIDCFLDWIERNKRRAENDGFVIAGTKSPKAGERSMEELSTSEQELLINVVGRLSQLNVDPVIIAKGTGLSIKTVSRYLDK